MFEAAANGTWKLIWLAVIARIGAGTPPTRIETPASSVGSGEPLASVVPESPRRNTVAKPPGSGNPGAKDAALTIEFAGTFRVDEVGAIFTTPILLEPLIAFWRPV